MSGIGSHGQTAHGRDPDGSYVVDESFAIINPLIETPALILV
jgi:hypothetical protein